MRKKLPLIIVGSLLFVCLLSTLTAYLLYKRYTREVENSNWSLEGEWIVFQCTPSGLAPKSSLYLVRPDGSKVMRLIPNQMDAGSPSWSPDGEEIVFEAPRGKLAILKRGAKKLTRLSITDLPYSSEYSPAWSPDGQWIAFISSPIKGSPTLLRVSSDGKIKEPVLEDVAVAPLTWTPDGQWIIYYESYWTARKVRIDGSEAQDYVEDGSEKRRFPNFPEGALYPTWSPDKQWVVFTNGGVSSRAQLFRMKADGSELQQLTDLDCSASSPDWIKMPGYD